MKAPSLGIFVIITSIFYNDAAAQKISDAEFQSFFDRLINNDLNNAANFVQINFQRQLHLMNETKDVSPDPLLRVDKRAFQIPTIAALINLHDNYIHNASLQEVVTPDELVEEHLFLNQIMTTPVIEITKNFLLSKGLAPSGATEFKNLLHKTWFTLYSRQCSFNSSSGFEHVFLGDVQKRKIGGFHDWVFFNREEEMKRVNYFGWFQKAELPNKKGAVISMKFRWNKKLKRLGSFFIGTSPEFEMALYTACFLARPGGSCRFSVGTKNLRIQTNSWKDDKSLIGGVFPIIL